MTQQLQRFCPICDRAFISGEAVLRCEGCGVMHHPACWVSKGGCATGANHKSTPIAQAYSTERPAGEPPARPGEGARTSGASVGATETARAPLPLRPARQKSQQAAAVPPPAPLDNAAGEPAPVIGVDDPEVQPIAPAGRLPGATPPDFHPPTRPRRAPVAYAPVKKPMPRVYSRHRILRFWYIPAAAVVATAVAFGVIWAAEQLTGGDDDQAAQPTTTVGTPAGSGSQGTPAPGGTTGTPSPAASRSPLQTGKFGIGDGATVSGTGDCLNVRVGTGLPTASKPNDAIVCLGDGSNVTVTGGPERKDDLTWWKVNTTSGEGWAVEDYLTRKP